MLRLPHSLHAELARAAQAHGTSLNRYITGALEEAVHAGDRPAAQRRGLPRAQVVLVVLVAVLAVVVIALALSR